MSLGGSDEDLAWLAGELSAIRRELLPAEESRALYLALDQGGNSSRAVLFDAAGREVASAHVPIATRRDGDRVEHDPDELAQSLLTAARDALRGRHPGVEFRLGAALGPDPLLEELVAHRIRQLDTDASAPAFASSSDLAERYAPMDGRHSF